MNPYPTGDGDLLHRFHDAGDRDALSLLFERHRVLAYRVALGVLGNAADAEDAAQEAFIRLIRFAPRAHHVVSMEGLVARLAFRSAQDLARSAGSRRAREAAWGTPRAMPAGDPFDQAAQHETRRALRRAVEELDDRYRLPILLFYYEDLSTRETAQALGITQTAVTTRLSRAVGKLRGRLAADGTALSMAALLALLKPWQAASAPSTLAARLQDLAASASPAFPAAAPLLGALGLGALKAKLAAGALAAIVTLGGVWALRQPPVGRRQAAGGSRQAAVSSRQSAVGSRQSAISRWQSEGRSPAAAVPGERAEGSMSAGGRRQAAAGRRLAAGGWRLPAVGTPRAAGGRGGPAGPVARSGQGAEHRQIAAAPPVAISAAGGRPAGRSARIAPENPTPCGAGAAIPRAAPTPGKSASVPDRERARASAAVRRTASAGTFPARSPETGARRLTAEQERCLAADICATAWAESRGTRYPFSHRFLGILARADLSRADELAEDLPPGPARDAITAELLRTDPDAGLARVHLNGVAPHLAARAARSLAARNPAAARVLLDRVIAAAQQAPPGSSFAAKTYAAALAKDLGDGRAADLVEEALQHPPPAPPLAGPWSIPRASRVAMSLSSLAQVDREAALRVVEQMLPPPERQYARESLATYVARGDPEGALQVLGEAPGQTDSFVEKQCWSLAALKVVVPLARRAAAKAEDLARRVPMPNHRSEALALAARALPAPAAAAARQEALDAAAQAGSVEAPARILTVAELMPPGPERVRLCAQALDLGSQRPEGVPLPLTIRAAFLLAPSAPETARAMLEDVLAVCPECEGPAGPWDLFPHPWGSTAPKDLRSSLAAAFAAVDPARAVEVARTIPADRPEQRFNALCKIAEYLLLPPDERLIVSSRYLLWGQSPRVREEE